MDGYELLADKISKEVPIIEADLLRNTGNEGVYRNGKIYIEKSLSAIKKRVIASEEYGHHKTTVGNILDLQSIRNRKEELQARAYAIEQLISIDDLLDCAFAGCSNKAECADYLEVTEEFLSEAIYHYHKKFGGTYFHKGVIFEFTEESILVIDTKLK